MKGLALPQGSVRSMLALIVVGSFVVFLVFGQSTEKFTEVVAALTGIAGTIIGFYFGSGGSGASSKSEDSGAQSSQQGNNLHTDDRNPANQPPEPAENANGENPAGQQ